MAIEVSNPDVVIDTLGHGDEPDALAGDHGQRIPGQLAERVVQ